MADNYNSIDELDAAVASGKLSFREAAQHMERLRAKSFRCKIVATGRNGAYVSVMQAGERVGSLSLSACNLLCAMEKADALEKLLDMAHWVTRGTFNVDVAGKPVPYPILAGNQIDQRASGVEQSF